MFWLVHLQGCKLKFNWSLLLLLLHDNILALIINYYDLYLILDAQQRFNSNIYSTSLYIIY